ncbi:MAG: hypothetical protein M0C28_41080 [Candidatus Moduliflexus flocculans]|nr:hypothetical protein [Candidatus Moduliflexus flocculans]
MVSRARRVASLPARPRLWRPPAAPSRSSPPRATRPCSSTASRPGEPRPPSRTCPSTRTSPCAWRPTASRCTTFPVRLTEARPTAKIQAKLRKQ